LNSVSTNIPHEVLPALAALAGNGISLESVSFDPSLPDPSTRVGHFSTANPNFRYMRQVVQDSINRPPAPPAPPTSAAPTTRAGRDDEDDSRSREQEQTEAPRSLGLTYRQSARRPAGRPAGHRRRPPCGTVAGGPFGEAGFHEILQVWAGGHARGADGPGHLGGRA